jgi:hypothetical protein
MDSDTYVYVISTVRLGRALGPCKCGITTNPPSRLSSLQTGNPHALAMSIFLGPVTSKEATEIEAEVHRAFRSFRMQGEWFLVDPVHLIDTVGAIFELMFTRRDDPVETAKIATRLGFYAPRMMHQILNPDGSEYTGPRWSAV